MILYAATISVPVMCSVSLVYGQVAIFINSYFTGKYLGITWWKQQKDYWPYIILSAIAVTPSYLLTLTELPHIITLTIGALTAAILYLLLLIWKKDDALAEFIPLLENRFPFLKGVLKFLRQQPSSDKTMPESDQNKN